MIRREGRTSDILIVRVFGQVSTAGIRDGSLCRMMSKVLDVFGFVTFRDRHQDALNLGNT